MAMFTSLTHTVPILGPTSMLEERLVLLEEEHVIQKFFEGLTFSMHTKTISEFLCRRARSLCLVNFYTRAR